MSALSPLKRAVASGLLHSGLLTRYRRSCERGRAVILLYHRVNDEADPFFPALGVRHFLDQVEYVARHYRVEPLETTLEWVASGAPGPTRAVLTFDDGYPDTHEHVLPALQRLGLPATLFLCTGPPETGRPVWNDRARAAVRDASAQKLRLPRLELPALRLDTQAARVAAAERVVARMKRLPPAEISSLLSLIEEQLAPRPRALPLLDWGRVRTVARGPVTFGAHTHNHFLVSRLTEAEIAYEVRTSVELIERRVGVRATAFAYPNGRAEDYDERSRAVLAGLGIRHAVTSRHGFLRPGSDPYQIARVYTTETSLPLFAARIAGVTREPSQEALA